MKPEEKRVSDEIDHMIAKVDPAAAARLGTNGRHETPVGEEQKFRPTDYGNSERLVARHGKDLHYCHGMKQWFCWDGVRWAPDSTAEVERLAKATVRSIYGEAVAIHEIEERQRLVNWGQRSEKATAIQAMMALARSEPGIPVVPSQLDVNPWLFNVANGTLDLRTGELLPHRRKDLLTKLAPVAYDPAARCPKWTKFLNEIFEPHPELIPFMQRAVGYALTGDTREECLFLLYGIGRNGKGTLIRTLMTMMGDYAGAADFSTFIANRNDDARPRDDIANMHGKRFISAQESRRGAAFDESIVKCVTGGDIVRARRLYENSFEFLPAHKIFLATNDKPVIEGTDPAIWSRIKLIPFEVSFTGRVDKTLKTALMNELPGILAWAVEGCLRWQEEGLDIPEVVTSATREYRVESDQVGRFIQECCVAGEYATAKARALYVAYKKWAEDAGERNVATEVLFSAQMGDRGFKKERRNTGYLYIGVGLLLSDSAGV
jgi:putative DNA primase/helicase